MKNVILTLISITMLFFSAAAGFTGQVFISGDEIASLEKSGRLIKTGGDSWKTRGGLVIKGRDPKGITRLEHIMRHSVNIEKRKKHGVFSIGKPEIIDLMDRTWSEIKSGGINGSSRGGRTAYTYKTGKIIGYMGGRAGKGGGRQTLKSVRIVVKDGTPEVVTFFPVK
ncbi:MAG: hypothetical protein MUD12_06095 [Spirochaetes bacterium]|jgi:hypothetical protein|nr:hypothetical protein [Spirochaetota bacterium]